MPDESRFRTWAGELDPNALSLWREAMAQLRQLHGDVWNGVRFFLTVNGIVVAAAFGLSKFQERDFLTGALISSLAVAGLIVTVIARRILAKHRDYYLGILLQKTLIERALGFYDQQLSGFDMSFPWKVDKQFVECFALDPATWLAEQKRRTGTITKLLFLVYEGVIGVHILILVATIVGLSCGYFG